MKIYIAGKITGLHPDDAFEAFERAELMLVELGHVPVNPMVEVDQTLTGWADPMKEAIRLLMDCEAVFLLTNWADSKGARLEKIIAEELGLKVIYANRAADLVKLQSVQSPMSNVQGVEA